jgi:hypothetical protein
MRSKKVLYFVIILAVVGLACGLDIGFQDVEIPFMQTTTHTPLPTRTATVTPTFPPKIESSGEEYRLEVLENNSTVFTDHILGYRIVFAPEWLVVPFDDQLQSEDYQSVAEELPPTMLQLLESTQQQAGIVLMALDYTLAYSPDESNTANINLVYQKNPAIWDNPLVNLLETNVEVLPTLIPDATVTYQTIQTNSKGVEYAMMVISQPASTYGMPVKQMVMLVRLEEGLLIITGTIQEDLYSNIEPVFKQVIGNFELID